MTTSPNSLARVADEGHIGTGVLSCFTRLYILGRKKKELEQGKKKSFGGNILDLLLGVFLIRVIQVLFFFFVPHREDGKGQPSRQMGKRNRGDEWSRRGTALINDLSFPGKSSRALSFLKK